MDECLCHRLARATAAITTAAVARLSLSACSPCCAARSQLRDLLQDDARTEAMIREAGGVYLDFCRQNATPQTVQVGAGCWLGAGWVGGSSMRSCWLLLLLHGTLQPCRHRHSSSRMLPLPHLMHLSTVHPALQLLLELAEAADVKGKVQALFAGKHINSTEDRAVSRF